jgi:hypothetical protein
MARSSDTSRTTPSSVACPRCSETLVPGIIGPTEVQAWCDRCFALAVLPAERMGQEQPTTVPTSFTLRASEVGGFDVGFPAAVWRTRWVEFHAMATFVTGLLAFSALAGSPSHPVAGGALLFTFVVSAFGLFRFTAAVRLRVEGRRLQRWGGPSGARREWALDGNQVRRLRLVAERPTLLARLSPLDAPKPYAVVAELRSGGEHLVVSELAGRAAAVWLARELTRALDLPERPELTEA